MLDQFVFVYLDDILIFSPNEESHVQHIRQVLQHLLDNQLFVKAVKCEFHASTVTFPDFSLHPDGPHQVQFSAVADWPTPTSRKLVQRFLGFSNFYRRFIRNFSTIATHLHVLTSPHVKFLWSPQAYQAFCRLKACFTSAPVLTLPDPQQQQLEVDASDLGNRVVLSQHSSEDNKLYPCAFLSRKLSSMERNHGMGNQEMLAMKVWYGMVSMEDHVCDPTALLVAGHGKGGGEVCGSLSCLHP